ncbi:hypothetical protein [Halomonas cerina]|uniref:Uncharacterized protein n=1 Tax=Halomonas cerina TaxID=447424 RepID=A0A839VDZ2_9GAMM|nr:hypothetical protein [Halomonas cerina]MBB3190696.1 hypothetical protein [Halomonas cerina]
MDVSIRLSAQPGALVDQLLPLPEVPSACLGFDALLACRLARARINLNRLERDTGSRDHSALAAARVEFALAARALADDLIARGLHSGRDGD